MIAVAQTSTTGEPSGLSSARARREGVLLWAVVGALVLGIGSPGTLVQARSFRVGLIPHGDALGCLACHASPSGGRRRNAFGKAVEGLVTPGGRETFWGPQLASQDADGDGLTNGQELQDPEGTWKADEPAPGDPSQVTNPGLANRSWPALGTGSGSAAGGAGSGPRAGTGAVGAGPAPRLELDVDSRLRYDRNPQRGDLDGMAYTDLRIRDLGQGTLDLKLAGWGIADLDAADDYDRAVDREPLRLTEAWGDLHGRGPLLRLRLGRQYLYEVDQLHYDGATWTIAEARRLSVFAFGGRAVSYYPAMRGDEWLGGGGLAWDPTWRDHQQLDAYLLAAEGESFGLSAWRWRHTWEDAWRSSTRLRFIDDECRDVRGLLFKPIEPWGADLSLDYILQPETQGQGEALGSRSLAALGRTLGPRAPYQRVGAELSKTFGEQWLAQFGGSVRRRLGSDGEDSFNSLNSNEGHVTLSRFNAFAQNLDLTLGLRALDTEQDSSVDVSGEIAYHPTNAWEFSLGASWSRYRLNPLDFRTDLNGEESPSFLIEDLDNLVYFVETRWRLSAAYEFLIGVDWDASDAVDGSGLRVLVGVRYRLRESLAEKARQ